MQQVENLVKCKPVWESSVDVMNIAHVYIMSLSPTNKRYRKRWQTFTQLMFYEYWKRTLHLGLCTVMIMQTLIKHLKVCDHVVRST